MLCWLIFRELSLLLSSICSQFFTGRVPLKEAIESKRPMTRTLLESMIAEVEKDIDDALARKAYTECAPLQQKLEELIQKRSGLPTISELEAAVKKAEQDIADAASRRDFAGAVMGQTALDDAKQRLEEAMIAEGLIADDDEHDKETSDDDESKKDENKKDDRFSSRAEIDAEISRLKKEMDDAISNKDFKKASSVQECLDEIEPMKELFPTMSELISQIEALKKEMDEAIKSKTFDKAGKLHDDIEDLEKKLTIEKEKQSEMSDTNNSTEDTNDESENNDKHCVTIDEEQKCFDSRVELEEEISRLHRKVQEAIDQKKFKDASTFQNTLDELENLRQNLPTLQELESEVNSFKKLMDEAINEKRFDKAEEIHNQLDDLEQKYKKEKEKQKDTVPTNIVQNPQTTTQQTKDSTTPKLITSPINNTFNKTNHENSIPMQVNLQAQPILPNNAPSITSQTSSTRKMTTTKKKRLNDNVIDVAKMLANKRGDAALITSAAGG
eukprot:13212130-Ditylum_brightwellii.AAC.1